MLITILDKKTFIIGLQLIIITIIYSANYFPDRSLNGLVQKMSKQGEKIHESAHIREGEKGKGFESKILLNVIVQLNNWPTQ